MTQSQVYATIAVTLAILSVAASDESTRLALGALSILNLMMMTVSRRRG